MLVLAEPVLSHFRKHRQARRCSHEARGQLFARLFAPDSSIEVATGPRPMDKRGRTYDYHDRHAEQREILSHYRRGFHYIGD